MCLRISTGLKGDSFRESIYESTFVGQTFALITCLNNLNVPGAFLTNSTWTSRKRRKKAFSLTYPLICLNHHLLNPHWRHPKTLNRGSLRFRISSLLPQRRDGIQCHFPVWSCTLFQVSSRFRGVVSIRQTNQRHTEGGALSGLPNANA